MSPSLSKTTPSKQQQIVFVTLVGEHCCMYTGTCNLFVCILVHVICLYVYWYMEFVCMYTGTWNLFVIMTLTDSHNSWQFN